MKCGFVVIALVFTIAAPASPAQSVLPTVSPERQAARKELGQLMVEYSADSFARQAAEGDTYAVRLFLLAGMDVNALSVARGATALTSAASRGRTETVQLLLAAHADVNLRPLTPNTPNAQFTALMRAAEGGFLDTVRVLLTAPVELNAKAKASYNGSNYDVTALELASMSGHTEIVAALLEKAANSGNAVAMGVCGAPGPPGGGGGGGGHVDTVRVLIEKGANVDSVTPYGTTGLVCAIQNKQFALVRLLLESGADPNLRNPLTLAIDGRNGEVVDLLLAHGANVNAFSTAYGSAGDTPLLRALNNGLADTVRSLIDRGADLNARDNAGGSALMIAATRGDTEISKLLLSKGVDVNARNRSGETPLIAAVSRGYTEIVKALIERGADVNVVTQNSTTPLKAAAGRAEIIQLLTSAGAK